MIAAMLLPRGSTETNPAITITNSPKTIWCHVEDLHNKCKNQIVYGCTVKILMAFAIPSCSYSNLRLIVSSTPKYFEDVPLVRNASVSLRH